MSFSNRREARLLISGAFDEKTNLGVENPIHLCIESLKYALDK